MIKAIALDDEPLALQIIEKLAKHTEFISLEKTFSNIDNAKNYIGSYPVDLIFLDINMPSMNGFNFYKSLKQTTMVIFTTAHSEYAIKGFEVNAIDYLLKPIEKNRFIQACEKAQKYYQYIFNKTESENNSLYVRSEYALVKILFSKILYLETMDDYIKIHLEDKKSVLTLMSMKKMMDILPQTEFLRVHRSFIVSIKKIDSVRNKTIFIDQFSIPIGTSYLGSINSAIKSK